MSCIVTRLDFDLSVLECTINLLDLHTHSCFVEVELPTSQIPETLVLEAELDTAFVADKFTHLLLIFTDAVKIVVAEHRVKIFKIATDMLVGQYYAELLGGDIAEDGIYLTGGTSQLSGMSDWLSKYIGIKVITADNYETCVARGIGNVLEHFDILKNGDYEFRTLQDLIIG